MPDMDMDPNQWRPVDGKKRTDESSEPIVNPRGPLILGVLILFVALMWLVHTEIYAVVDWAIERLRGN
jgi:hypothetical protein